MLLAGCEHVQSGVGMDVVIPRIELPEVTLGAGLVDEEAWINRVGLNRREVCLNERIVVWGSGPTEELPHAKFLEVAPGRLRPHLAAAIAERLGPSGGRLV